MFPVLQDLFQDPVIAADGHTYSRAALIMWFLVGRRTSPLTNMELTSTELKPDDEMRKGQQVAEGAPSRSAAALCTGGASAEALKDAIHMRGTHSCPYDDGFHHHGLQHEASAERSSRSGVHLPGAQHEPSGQRSQWQGIPLCLLSKLYPMAKPCGRSPPVLVCYSSPQQCFISRIKCTQDLKCSAKEWHATT